MAHDLKYGVITVQIDSEAHPLNADESSEPVFIIRAQDALSVEALREYQNLCRAANLNDHGDKIDGVVTAFEEWQEENPQQLKYPD